MRLAQALEAGIRVAARIGKRSSGGLAALLLLGLLVGGSMVHVQSRPWFDGWYNIYLDARESEGCPPWDCHGTVSVPKEQFLTREEIARREAEAARQAAWLEVAGPWIEAGRSRLQAREDSFAKYAPRMDRAPRLCRRELRARLPEGWTAAPILLGPSERGPALLTWRVSGRTDIVDETGVRRSYRYRCEFAGDELHAVVLTTVEGIGEPIVLVAGP